MTRWNATIEGRIASLKNSKRVVRAGGRTIVLPSKAHQAFLERALPQLAPHRPREPFGFPYALSLTFHLKGKLDADADNLVCSVNDLLMEAGIVESDSRNIVICASKRPGALDFLTEVAIVEMA